MILLLAGLPGTGKSTLARALASALGADVLDRDAIRNAIFPQRDLAFCDEQNALCSRILYQVAEHILQRDPTRVLIFDGRPFSKAAQIDEVATLAERVGTPLRIILCEAPEELVQARLTTDLHAPSALPVDNRRDKYWRDKAAFEQITRPHLVLDTSQAVQSAVQVVVESLAFHY